MIGLCTYLFFWWDKSLVSLHKREIFTCNSGGIPVLMLIIKLTLDSSTLSLICSFGGSRRVYIKEKYLHVIVVRFSSL